MACNSTDNFTITGVTFVTPSKIQLVGLRIYVCMTTINILDAHSNPTSGPLDKTASIGTIKATHSEFLEVWTALSTFINGTNAATLTYTCDDSLNLVPVCSVSSGLPYLLGARSLVELDTIAQSNLILQKEVAHAVFELRKMTQLVEEGLALVQGERTEIKKKAFA